MAKRYGSPLAIGVPVTLIALTILAILAPWIAVGAVGVGGGIYTARKLGWWRTVVSMSIIMSVLRGIVDMPDAVAYALQFGPVLVGIVAFLVDNKPSPLRRVDKVTLFALAGIVVAALLSSITSIAPRESFSQTALLALMTLFLALTFAWRWQTATIIRGDLVLVFTLICATQLAGIVGAVTGIQTMIVNYGRFQGILTNANYAGFLAAVAILLAVYVFSATRHRALAVIGVAISVPTLVLSGSRGGLLATVVGIFVLLLLPNGRKVLVPLGWAGSVVTLFICSFQPEIVERIAKFFGRDQQRTDLTSGRIRIYEEILQRWQQDPLLGTGYRTIETYSRDGHSGHNTYLSVLAETGIIGAIVLAAFIVCIIMAGTTRSVDKTLIGGVVGVAVMELTESSVFGWGGPTALVSWLLVLGYAALGRTHTQKVDHSPVSHVAQKTVERDHAVGTIP